MRWYRGTVAGTAVISLGLALATCGYAFTRTELAEYEQKELKAPEFCLKDVEGKSHCLKDYLGKGMYIAIQTGSST